LLGAERGALTGYVFIDYVAKEDQETLIIHVWKCAREKREVTFELRLTSKSGRLITAQVHSIPIEGPMAETLCKTAVTDITERRMAEESRTKMQSAPHAYRQSAGLHLRQKH
jgi:PAS domain S-box-containing protein